MTTPREPFTCLYRGTLNDDKVLLRSELGQRVYIYLLQTTMGNGLGCFKAGMAAMAEDLRMTPERFAEGFREGFDERLGEPLFVYDENARVVFIPKYLKRNPPSNPNGIRALAKSFLTIPECKLKHDCYQAVKEFVEGKNKESKGNGETFLQAFQRTFVEPSSNHADNLRQTMLATFAKPPGINTLSCSLSLSSSPSSQKEEGGEVPEVSGREERDPTASLSLGFSEPTRTPGQDDGHQLPPDASPGLLAIVEAMQRVEFVVPGKGMETIWKNVKMPVRLAVKLEEACPAVDVPALIGKLAGWTVANPSRAKINIGKFVWNAATREQDTPRPAGQFQQQWRGVHNEGEQPPRKIVDLTEVVAKMAERLDRE